MRRKLLSWIERTRHDCRGNVSIIFALAMIPVVGSVGSAVDYSRGSSAKAALQAAADAAALAGAALKSNDPAARMKEAKRFFEGSLKPSLASHPTVKIDGDKVIVSAATKFETAFLGLLGVNHINVSVSATAISAKGPPICVLGLNQSAAEDVAVKGNATLVAKDCAVQSNSASSTALSTAGLAKATAEAFCAVGGYSGWGFLPKPQTECQKVADPFAGLPQPANVACDYHDTVFKLGLHEATPGVYCGGILLEAAAIVSFKPGVYVIRDGPLKVLSKSAVTDPGVIFYFYGTGSYLEIKSGSSVTITAPKTGPYAGIAFAQHAGSSAGLTSLIEGGGLLLVIGAVYFPTQALDIGGLGVINADSPYMPIVADKILARGNATLVVKADHAAAGFTDLLAHVSQGSRLIY